MLVSLSVLSSEAGPRSVAASAILAAVVLLVLLPQLLRQSFTYEGLDSPQKAADILEQLLHSAAPSKHDGSRTASQTGETAAASASADVSGIQELTRVGEAGPTEAAVGEVEKGTNRITAAPAASMAPTQATEDTVAHPTRSVSLDQQQQQEEHISGALLEQYRSTQREQHHPQQVGGAHEEQYRSTQQPQEQQVHANFLSLLLQVSKPLQRRSTAPPQRPQQQQQSGRRVSWLSPFEL